MKIVYIFAAAALLAGCMREPIAEFTPPAVMRYNVGSYRAYEFRLADGTRCVTIGEAITCEWQQPVVLVPRPQ
jgi:hypothetical protein